MPEDIRDYYIRYRFPIWAPALLPIGLNGGGIFYAYNFQEPGTPTIVAVAAGDIGYCKNTELGYWLAQPFWGQGISTAAVRHMVAYGFQTFDITRIFARPFGTNRASQRVLEKSGFSLEAQFTQTLFKQGEFLDEWVYAIRRKES